MPRRSPTTKSRTNLKTGQRGSQTRDEAGQRLLEAIRNSATSMDQIVLRRIGRSDAPPTKLK